MLAVKVLFCRPESVRMQSIFLALGIAMIYCPALSQTQPDRVWLAGRYDGNRLVVYFDAVHFNDTIPPEAEKLVCPVTVGFFCPLKLPAGYVAQFQKQPRMEHFALGDQYDVVEGRSSFLTATVTTLVGFESDEGVGNDSFIGALLTLEKDKQDWLMYSPSYVAVRRHRKFQDGEGKASERSPLVTASLLNEPLRFDIQREIVDLLTARMKATATDLQRHDAESVPPVFAVQQFDLADGGRRYYARAAWRSGKGSRTKLIYGLGAWITPLPVLRVLAVETEAGFEYLPNLLNVIDLGRGRVGIIVSEHGDDSASLSIVEYRDGMTLGEMPVLQSIGSAE